MVTVMSVELPISKNIPNAKLIAAFKEAEEGETETMSIDAFKKLCIEEGSSKGSMQHLGARGSMSDEDSLLDAVSEKEQAVLFFALSMNKYNKGA